MPVCVSRHRFACSETYDLFSLPFCKPPQGIEHKPLEALADVLTTQQGVRTAYELPFGVDKERTVLCTQTLLPEQLQQFKHVRYSALLSCTVTGARPIYITDAGSVCV